MSVALVAHLSACSSTDKSDANPEAGAGGSTNTGGSSSGGAGTGGTATGGSSATGGNGATDSGADSSTDSGTGGATGTGGSTSTGPDGGCPTLGALTKPVVDSSIAVPATTTLKTRFYAVGYQIYTCTATTALDAAVTYAWKTTPDANLYDDTCSDPKASHYAGPTWKSLIDDSYVVGAKVGQYQPLLSDGGADTADILWLKLTGAGHPSPDGGAGLFSDVTYIQRLNTTNGALPSSDTCSGSNVNEIVKVPYTAVYYFYTGT